MKPFISTAARLLRMRGRKAYVCGQLYTLFTQWCKLRENTVLIESTLGREFEGSPYAIADYLCRSPEYHRFAPIFVAPTAAHRVLRRSFRGKRIHYVRKNSLRYCFYLATSEYLVNDATFPLYFSRRQQQKYLNTWHGTPLKTLGRQIREDTFRSFSNTQRNFFHTTLLIAPNTHTKHVLCTDYMLNGIWLGSVFQCGYPRNDVLFRSQRDHPQSSELNVAFMPTWRGTLTNVRTTSAPFLDTLRTLFHELDTRVATNVTLWVRLHPLVAGHIDLRAYTRIKPFPEHVPTYRWLAKCDALITDYSSVLFDYAITGRPILLYMPDENTYTDSRGFYIHPETLPFPLAKNHEGLAKNINSFAGDPQRLHCEPDEAYRSFQATYCPWDDGKNTARVCERFFNSTATPSDQTEAYSPRKKSLLIYVGALLNNGIVTSFKSLLPLIDSSRYDVTILADTGYETQQAEAYFRSLKADIRYIPLYLRLFVTPTEFAKLVYLYLFRRQWPETPVWLKRIWQREFRRIAGDAHFDVFVNFNGYSWRAALLSLGAPSPSVIYVHNEMAKEIRGDRVADARLLLLSYKIARRVAMVRQGVEKQYCAQHFNYSDKLLHVPNALMHNVLCKANNPLQDAFFNGIDARNYNRVEGALNRPQTFRLLNLARFSPEKGQMRLIEAFEQCHAKHKNMQLFIVGSHGRIKGEIENRAQMSSACGSIFVVTGSDNPFPLAKHADVFISSSTYEGLPVVFFEALQLSLPIVSTDIPGPAEFLREGYGLVVENSVAGLIRGMEAAIAGEVPRRPFDVDAHNAFAVQKFYELVDSVGELEDVRKHSLPTDTLAQAQRQPTIPREI